MYGTVQVSRRSLEEHRPHAGDEVIEQLRSQAVPLRGARVLNLTISPFGTGVADLLHGLVPLLRDLGLDVDWHVAGCTAESAHILRLIYAGLSGRRVEWTPEARENWHQYNKFNAELFEDRHDVVVVHEPQLAGLREALAYRSPPVTQRAKWVWHCHLDLRGAQPEVLGDFLPALRGYDAWVLQDPAFAPQAPMSGPPVVIPPAIDPTCARNLELPRESVRQFLHRNKLDPARPVVVHVGPFDTSFDPIGVVDAYRRARQHRPDLQLLLVHSMSEASLEAWSRFERVARYVGSDPNVRVLCGQGDGSQVLVNAAQRAAHVVLQRSVPAGFSLSVWEGLWKGRPALVGAAGGLPLQVYDGVTGHLAQDEAGFVEGLLTLIDDPVRARRLGSNGRRMVRERHLITRFLADELRLLRGLLSNAQPDADKDVLLHA